MPIGGGKGGSDFDPKGRSDAEVMRFCQSLHDRAVPPPGRVHRRARRRHRRRRSARSATSSASTSGSPTATSPACSPARAWRTAARRCASEATGYGTGLLHRADACQPRRRACPGRRVVVSGSGNVAIYAAAEGHRSSARQVVACSDSSGVRRRRGRPRPRPAAAGQGGRPRPRISAYADAARRARRSSPGGSRLGRADRDRAALRHPERARRRGRAGPRRRAASSRSPRAPTCRARPTPPASSRRHGRRSSRPGKAAQRRRRRPPARWRCSRTPRATPGPSAHTEERLHEIMTGVHERCASAADDVRLARQLRRRRQHRQRSCGSPTPCSRSASSEEPRRGLAGERVVDPLARTESVIGGSAASGHQRTSTFSSSATRASPADPGAGEGEVEVDAAVAVLVHDLGD